MNVKYLKLWSELTHADSDSLIEDLKNARRELTHADSDSLVEDLKNALYEWEEKEYPSDKARWQSYVKDITELVDYYGSEAGWKKKKSKKYKQ